MLAKYIIGKFSRFSKEPQLFYPKIVHHCTQDDFLGIKKVLAPSKNPVKSLIMCFPLKNITSRTIRNSSALIVNLDLLKVLSSAMDLVEIRLIG